MTPMQQPNYRAVDVIPRHGRNAHSSPPFPSCKQIYDVTTLHAVTATCGDVAAIEDAGKMWQKQSASLLDIKSVQGDPPESDWAVHSRTWKFMRAAEMEWMGTGAGVFYA